MGKGWWSVPVRCTNYPECKKMSRKDITRIAEREQPPVECEDCRQKRHNDEYRKRWQRSW